MKAKFKLKKIRIMLSVIMALSFIVVPGCDMSGKKLLTDPITVTDYKLNTIVKISSYNNISKDKLTECLNLCDYYENMFSRTRETSTLYKVNHGELKTVPKELGELIEKGLYYSELSGGAFDVAIGSVSDLWDFTSDTHVIPSDDDINEALKYVDYTKVKLTKNDDGTYNIDMPHNTMLDLGAIAKGYIADRLKEDLLSKGITNAIIDLGGNVLCVGQKNDTTPFTIGVKKPFTQTGEVLMGLSINDISVVSSGTYERYFYDNGKFYYHILNPKTGYPYETDITGVTIISSDSVSGDCLSTTCFVLGADKGLELINSLDNTEAVYVMSDGSMRYSDNAASYIKK